MYRTEYGEIRRYGVSLRIHSKCEKMRTRITPNTDTFYAVVIMLVRRIDRYLMLSIKVIFNIRSHFAPLNLIET